MTALLERVLQGVNEERLRKNLLEMLDIYSPSGKEEDIQLYLEEVLSSAGCRVERQTVEEDRYNLKVVLGNGDPELFLVGHVDTVHAWDLEQVGAQEENGVIHALGSADMKGGCAAMLEAFLVLNEVLSPLEHPNVGLLLVVGEEENGDGSATFLESATPPWVVIGEPTGLAGCFSHFGYLEAGFVTHGLKRHSSLPELGHNAVESMLRVLLHLGKDPLFNRDRSQVVYSIREMHSSQKGFVVPDRCETWIDLHLPPDRSPVDVQEAIRRVAEDAKLYIPGLKMTVDFDFAAAGYNLGTENRPAEILRKLYPQLGLNLHLDAFRSHSDGNLFFAAGVKPLILGPGALETAHTPDEQVPFREVVAAARIYAALCLLMGRS
ncbi:M20/M25/M40 family metallo-hydrolase [Geomonas sp. RF6]|uniref:M20 family metallopeptidase n=1 Tax=Geomonas sp. RF6 TaxID=2897342 RepID=UPI001E592DE9|nr:M20/M25/M40 family metallo-hydrolase [Geomonas sp. RF6]UFS69431.1 M20/M25/M40 family metallo-hydrolase [Geomonas sp. RF6]